MLTLPPTVRIYVATEPVDARKSYDGLSAMVTSVFGEEPLSGHLFVFINRRGDQIQVLFFDRSGYCIVKKRLEAGTFRLAKTATGDARHVEVDGCELAMLLEGIDLTHAIRRKRWSRSVRRGPSTDG